MALIECSECHGQVSTAAKNCPKCGAPVKAVKRQAGKVGIILLGLFFGVMVLIVALAPHQEEPSQPPRTVVTATHAPVSSTVPNEKPAPPIPHTIINEALATRGELILNELKAANPDAKDQGLHSLPPRTIEVVLEREMSDSPSMALNLPKVVWDKVSEDNRAALIEYLKSQIVKARTAPERFMMISPSAIAFPSARKNVQGMKDDAWNVSVGRLNLAGYLIDTTTVLTGADYAQGNGNFKPEFSAVNDPVNNDPLDGSVHQIKEYLSSHLNDAASVQYDSWGKVTKTGTGYTVWVRYRAKNALGGYILKDQTFDLSSNGNVISAHD